MLLLIPRFIADFLTILVKKYYFDTFLADRRSPKSGPLFWTVALMGEGTLFFISSMFNNSYSPLRPVVFIAVNSLVLFTLSLFYYSRSIFNRLLVVFSLQAIDALSEGLTGSLFSIISPTIVISDTFISETYIVTISGIVSFLIISTVCTVWKTQRNLISAKHGILMGFTPVCSLLILLSMSFGIVTSDETNMTVLSIFVIMLLLNIVNYVLLNDIIKENILRETVQNQEKQLYFQSEKFSQLSNAYKEMRSVIHEVKRYNSYISACVKNADYDKIIEFLENSSRELEERFVKFNTGNLVIDTLITNYSTIAEMEKIPFYTEIKIDKDDISINDYDLCIVLGNLLDNSLNAAHDWFSKYGEYAGFEISVRLFTKGNFLIIHIHNTIADSSQEKTPKDDLYHGYGLTNVEKIVKKYSGIYYRKDDSAVYETTISLPIVHDSTGISIKQDEYYDEPHSFSSAPPPKKIMKNRFFRHRH